jgi:hypothetical protein
MKHSAPRCFKMICLPVILLAALLFGGCATHSVASRKQQRMAAYQALSPEIRAAVDLGRLKVGMDTNAVYIAWGPPQQILHGGNPTRETTTWLYRAGYIQEVRFQGTYREHDAYTVQPYTKAQVVFVNDAVQQWQTFPSPMY